MNRAKVREYKFRGKRIDTGEWVIGLPSKRFDCDSNTTNCWQEYFLLKAREEA